MNATGQYGEALEFASRALAIAVREQDLYGEVLSRITMGRNLLMLHRNQEAAECLSIAREIVERNGYDAIKANLTGAIATALARTGEAHRAVGLVDACMESGMHLRTGQMEVCYLHAGYGEALVQDGQSQRGLSALERALSIARSIRRKAKNCRMANTSGYHQSSHTRDCHFAWQPAKENRWHCRQGPSVIYHEQFT